MTEQSDHPEIPLGPWDGSGEPVPTGPARARWSARRWGAVGAGALAFVLVGSGVAYGVVTHRPDYQLSEVLSATADRHDDGARLSLETDAASLEALGADHDTADLMARSAADATVRIASSGSRYEVSLEVGGSAAARSVSGAGATTVVVDWGVLARLPFATGARSSVAGIQRYLSGEPADAVAALLGGRPVTLESAGSSGLGGLTSRSVDPAQVQEAAAAIVQVLRDHATVADGGDDQYGHRFVVTVPLQPVWDEVQRQAMTVSGSKAGMPTLPTGLTDAIVPIEVWERDGVVSRVRFGLGDLIARSYQADKGGSLPTVNFAVVAVPDSDGVLPIPGAPVVLDGRDLFGASLGG